MFQDNTNPVRRIVLFALCISMIAMIIICFQKLNKDAEETAQKEQETWNNGYCSECNGKYEYLESVGIIFPDYIYKCRNCGATIKTNEFH